ncbi:MAG: dihydrodipicolinate synthase family protein [Candidatus Aminicenantes bacterium]|nr:dihydrodipicolinate synthase family protein [Candidatus Aminicenantes bacterium]
MTKPFEGIFAALTTPFEGDEVSVARSAENIARYNGTGLAGYLVLGSTGESVFLSDEEAERLVRAVKQAAAPGKRVIVGTARESTRLTVDFTNRMADLGAEAALVRPPAYYKGKMTRDALRAHYLTLADNARLPILVYNIPQNTGLNLEPALVVELAKHPRIAGLKESSGSLAFLGEIRPVVPPEFCYLLGSGHVIYPGLEMGADGAILAVANAAPEVCCRIYALFRDGRKDEARKLQLDLIPFNKAVMETYGIAGIKYAQSLRGYYGGETRLPLLPVSEVDRTEIRALLEKLGAL